MGLKPQHTKEVVETRPDVGFFEVHAENYMVDGGPFHHWLSRVREAYPLSIHGVGLSIGAKPLWTRRIWKGSRYCLRNTNLSRSQNIWRGRHTATSSTTTYCLSDTTA